MKTLQEITFNEIPIFECSQSWNPKFRTMTLEEIDRSINPEMNWFEFGYAYAGFCRDLATVYFIRKSNSKYE